VAAHFRRNPRGLFFGTLFRIVGRPIFGHYARQVIANRETLERSRLIIRWRVGLAARDPRAKAADQRTRTASGAVVRRAIGFW
jgi:hypothetical protein